jgi:uncharacterized protein (TIGR02466 family)
MKEILKNNYFSTPIWLKHNPDYVEQFNHISDHYLNKPEDKNIGKFRYVNHSENLLVDENFHPFLNYLGNLCGDFLTESGFDLKKYTLGFTELWVQEFSRSGGSNHSTHIHSNQHVSGFYFLKCSDKTSYPVFYDPRTGALATKLPEIDMSKITNASSSFHYKPVPGTLILFPGYLAHEFVVDEGLDDFRFIHFNLQAFQHEI